MEVIVMYIDSHLHLSNEDYDIDEVIKSAKENDVKYFITGGTNKKIICVILNYQKNMRKFI